MHPTRRAKEILVKLREGHTSKEIGASLYISPPTVETHKRNLMAKLRAHNTVHLAVMAERQGFLQYKKNESRHVGPMAQDFYKAFGLGADKSISTIDADAIALAAIKELNEKVTTLEKANETLLTELSNLKILLLKEMNARANSD